MVARLINPPISFGAQRMYGPRLRQLRFLRGLTRADIAAACMVTEKDVFRWETGRRNPGPAAFRKFCEITKSERGQFDLSDAEWMKLLRSLAR